MHAVCIRACTTHIRTACIRACTTHIHTVYDQKHTACIRSLQRGHLLLGSNAAIKVLKYFMVNQPRFLKGYHNRVYFYSSGTIISQLVQKFKFKQYMQHVDGDGGSEASDDDTSEDAQVIFADSSDEDSQDESESYRPPKKSKPGPAPMPAETMLRKVCVCNACLYTRTAARIIHTVCIHALTVCIDVLLRVYTLFVRIYNQAIHTPFFTYTNTAARLRELLPTDR